MIKKIKHFLNDELLQSLLKNGAVLFSGNTIAAVFNLASLWIISQGLETKQFGILILIQTYALTVDRLVNFQSWQAVIKYGAVNKAQRQLGELRYLIKLGTILDASSALLGTGIAIFGACIARQLFGWDDEILQMAAVYSLVIMFNLSGTPTGILRLFNRFGLVATQQAIGSFLKAAAVGIVYYKQGGLWAYLLIWMMADIFNYLLLLIMGHFVLFKNNVRKWWRAGSGDWWSFFRFTWWTNVVSTLDLPVKQLDMFIVASVVSLEGVAVYKIIKQVSMIIRRLSDPLYQAIYPQLAELVAAGNDRKAVQLSVKTGKILFSVAIPVTLVVCVSSKWWLKFFGEVFAAYWPEFSVYFLFSVISMTFVCIHPLFVAMGYVRRNFFILLVANGCFLAIAILLGKQVGLMGIVIAYGIQFSTVLFIKLYYIWRRLRLTGQRSAEKEIHI